MHPAPASDWGRVGGDRRGRCRDVGPRWAGTELRCRRREEYAESRCERASEIKINNIITHHDSS